MDNKSEILTRLYEQYKDTSTALVYSNPFELFVAVVLSAQCTDERVNKVTARLFPELNRPEEIVALTQEELEGKIRDCGLFRSKARNILQACKLLIDNHKSKLPASFDELIKLPGVGRKTANVLISHLFNTPAIAVDTHVFRVANRLGLANGKTPLEVERALMQIIPQNHWSESHHWLIWHGRKVCKARAPQCTSCFLSDICHYYVVSN